VVGVEEAFGAGEEALDLAVALDWFHGESTVRFLVRSSWCEDGSRDDGVGTTDVVGVFATVRVPRRASPGTHGPMQHSDFFLLVRLMPVVEDQVHDFLDQVHQEESKAEEELCHLDARLREPSRLLELGKGIPDFRLKMHEGRVEQDTSTETQEQGDDFLLHPFLGSS